MSSLLKTIIFCGRNNIPLRGRRDDDPTNESLQGNFQALLNFRIDSGDEVLQNHLENSSRNATYISKTIQNELITTVGKYILGGLSLKIRERKYSVYLQTRLRIYRIKKICQLLYDLSKEIRKLEKSSWAFISAKKAQVAAQSKK